MRKIFRMAYESCSGQCYDHSDVMRIHTLGLYDIKRAAAFLSRLLEMHAPSCGNPNIQFRLDVDEFEEDSYREVAQAGLVPCVDKKTRFVASFYRYGALDLFGGPTALEAMNKLIDGALAWYASDEGKARLAADSPVDRANACHHGDDRKLIDFAIEFSGLDAPARAALRAEFI